MSAAEFAALMEQLGPWPAPPRLAVACSGGADSLALTLLADGWVRARRGRLAALTVDHGLRPESAAEARQVGDWLRRRRIDHHILVWAGPKPSANLPALAREARYRLLGGWCREHRCIGLLLGHQLEDQAETLLLRMARGSGLDGLAGMAPVTQRSDLRLLRPLLAVPRARLEATLRAHRQPWVEDPSNRDPVYARSRIRALLPALAAEGLTAARLAATASRLAGSRATLSALTDRLLAEAASLSPAGYCLVRPAILAAAPRELSLRALARLLALTSGADVPPRFERLERLHGDICEGGLAGGRTLHGCCILPWRGQVLICREPAAMAPPIALARRETALWDNRFRVQLTGRRQPLRHPFEVGALGLAGWRQIGSRLGDRDRLRVPGAVRPSLPALFDLDGVVAVPHLGYRRPAEPEEFVAVFQPVRRAMAGDGRCLLSSLALDIC